MDDIVVANTGLAISHLYVFWSRQDLRERYARVELRASAPLVAFKETVAASPSSPITPGTGTTTSEAGGDCGKPPQLTVPPWCEEEGTQSTKCTGRSVLEASVLTVINFQWFNLTVNQAWRVQVVVYAG